MQSTAVFEMRKLECYISIPYSIYFSHTGFCFYLLNMYTHH